jgi:hypothetical protein
MCIATGCCDDSKHSTIIDRAHSCQLLLQSARIECLVDTIFVYPQILLSKSQSGCNRVLNRVRHV